MADLPSDTLDKPVFKTSVRYSQCYDAFMKWKQSNGIDSIDEPVLLAYFGEVSKKRKPSSLWSIFSMLKNTLISNHGVNIGEYTGITSFLKEKNVGFHSQKAKIFTAEEVNQFLVEAPNYTYLAMKVRYN